MRKFPVPLHPPSRSVNGFVADGVDAGPREDHAGCMIALFVVSDATGQTGERVLRSALVQFPDADHEIVRHGGIRTPEQVHEVVSQARRRDATILHTLVSNDLRACMLTECRRQVVDAMDLMGPVLDRLAMSLQREPQEEPGLFEQLRQQRIRAIEAVEFAFRHDDGQRLHEIEYAEIVLVGLSRTMKTPTSLFLAHRGWFVANVPIVPPLPPPAELLAIDPRRVFAMTIRPSRLAELRRVRAQHLHLSASDYVDLPSIRGEIREAEILALRHRWYTVDVTAKSVEEASREILDLREMGKG